MITLMSAMCVSGDFLVKYISVLEKKNAYFLLGVADIQFHGGTLVESIQTSATHTRTHMNTQSVGGSICPVFNCVLVSLCTVTLIPHFHCLL